MVPNQQAAQKVVWREYLLPFMLWVVCYYSTDVRKVGVMGLVFWVSLSGDRVCNSESIER